MNPDAAAVFLQLPADDGDRRAFPRSIHPQKSEELPSLHPETEVVHGFYVAEGFA